MGAIRIAAMTVNYFIQVFAMVSLILGVLYTVHMFRARAMRAFAARWNFQYLGPLAPKPWNPSHLKMSPPLPGWVSHFQPGGKRITQVWNVVEGQQHGIPVFIFDCVVGEYRRSGPCTVIAYQSEQNPFGAVASADRVVQSHGWTVLHGVWFLWFSWTMRVKRLDEHLNELQVGQRA
jgi:hypothetical protein